MSNRNTVILEVNFQNREFTIYKCFEGAEGNYCVFLGKNKKSLNSEWLRDHGKIEDRNGVEVEYVPFLKTSSYDFEEHRERFEKASAFPIGSYI